MGLGQSQSSLPSHRRGGPANSADGAGSIALFDADEEQGKGAPRSSQGAPSAQAGRSRGTAPPSTATLSPRDRALWLWANVDDLDAFFSEAYAYYLGKGVVCIALSRVLNLVTVAFVIGFSTFLFGCVDYSKIRHDGKLDDVVVKQCFSKFSIFTKFAYLLFGGFFLWQVSRFVLGLPRLRAMHHFYTYLLDIPDVSEALISLVHLVTDDFHAFQTGRCRVHLLERSGEPPVCTPRATPNDVPRAAVQQRPQQGSGYQRGGGQASPNGRARRRESDHAA